MAVESAFQLRLDPESVETKDSPPLVFASVIRRILEPNVGSMRTEFAGPSVGAGGMTFVSVPVYAEYADGGVCACSEAQNASKVPSKPVRKVRT